MKKFYLIPVFLCFIAGIIKANVSYTGYFPSCSLTVTASTDGFGSTICAGSSVPLLATPSSGTAPYTYTWTPSMSLNNAAIANPTASPTVTSTYAVHLTDHAGCTASASVTITVNQPPVVNPDSLLLQYLTNEPLKATGGVSPYTYAFSPAVSTNTLLDLPNINTTVTITVTGANGCASIYHANYVALKEETEGGSCSTIYMTQYIQDTLHNDDAIQLFNPTLKAINLNNYYLTGSTNGSLLSPPFLIQLHGMIKPHQTFLIANTHADTVLTDKAGMLSDSLSFKGKDIVTLVHAVINSPTVNFALLDQVGTLSPLPTDTGWAVGSGSTKNHTLVRQANVEQGTMNWAIGQSQWTVYPVATFNKLGRYRNSCTLSDPNLTLSFANDSTICDGSSHYFEFDVMVSSDQPTWFDNCVMWVPYNAAAFGNNIVAGGNVTVTAYPNFSPPTYANPQPNIYDLSPDTLGLPCGVDQSQASWSRTQINSTPQQMLHVKIKVEGCGNPADISFTDTSLTQIFSYYTVNQTDSVINAVPYNYTYFTGSLTNTLCQMAITDFNAPIDAGIGSTLTITGDDFGTTRGNGEVKFFDADSSNYHIQRMNDGDYISWSNNQIQIKLPAFADTVIAIKPGKELTIGGANFIVKNSCGDSAISSTNTNGAPFSVYYNINQYWNPTTPAQKKEILLRSTDTNGGYVLRFDSITFPKHSIQRFIFEKAMRDWTCFVGVNWTVGKDTSYTYTPLIYSDGLNYVFFTSHLLGSNVVAQTDINPDECSGSIDILKEAVTYFNSSINFIYDTTETVSIPLGYCDFYGVCLHELGHFIELNHSTDSTSLMYWTANTAFHHSISAANRITLGTAAAAAAVDGGIYSVQQSIGIASLCNGLPAMIGKNTSCTNSTSINNVQKSDITFSIYPNPSQGTFTVKGSINDYTLVVTNMLGKRILSKKMQNEKSVIDISTEPNGMYFIQEQYNNGVATQKLIINR